MLFLSSFRVVVFASCQRFKLLKKIIFRPDVGLPLAILVNHALDPVAVDFHEAGGDEGLVVGFVGVGHMISSSGEVLPDRIVSLLTL